MKKVATIRKMASKNAKKRASTNAYRLKINNKDSSSVWIKKNFGDVLKALSKE